MTAYPERPRVLTPEPVDWYGPEDAPQPPDYDPERGDLLNGFRPPKELDNPSPTP